MCATFKIQMYFGPGYEWQGRTYEFEEFCWMRNYFGINSWGLCFYNSRRWGLCWPDAVYVASCRVEDMRQLWTFVDVGGGEFLIKNPNQLQCLENTSGKAVRMRLCDRSNPNQRFTGSTGSSRFAISHNGRCLGQDHHPKDGEVVELSSCDTLQQDDTLYVKKAWI